MNLNKNDLHTLKYIRAYKIFAGFGMAFGTYMLLVNLYDSFFKALSKHDFYLHNQLIGASMSVVGLSYIMWHNLNLIKKLKNQGNNKSTP
jgi:hypothetical protein